MQAHGRRHRRRRGQAVQMLEPALLLLLHHGPGHGYTLLEGLGEFDLAHLDPSGVYRTLRDMEAKGRVVSTWDEEETQGPPRRVYRITALGDEMLALWVQDLEEGKGRIDHLLSAYQHQWMPYRGHAWWTYRPCCGP